MRTLTLLATLLALSTLPPALAHLTHATCSSTSAPVRQVHVDSFGGSCRGVVVSWPYLACDGGLDVHAARGVHVLVLYENGCQTGVVVQPVRVDAPAPLLP